MARDVARDWMWSEACEMLARAERMHRELFRPAASEKRLPAWEPPVDILETELEVLVLVALPGVEADNVQAVIEDSDLVIAGTRLVPKEWRRLYILIGFRPASWPASLKAARRGLSRTGRPGSSSLTNTKSSSLVA